MLIVTGRQTYAANHSFRTPRETPCYTLELTYSGTMLRRSGAMRRFLPQPNHTLLLTPPAVPYALRGRQSGEEIWLLFTPRPELQGCLDWPVGAFGIPELRVPQTPLGRQVFQAFEDAHQCMSSYVPRKELLAENALERLLLLAGQLSGHVQKTTDPRIEHVLNIIHGQCHMPQSVASLAAAAGLSTSRLAHLFRQQTGVAPIQYVEDARLEQAQFLLLRTDMQIKEVAARVGFADPYYFSTRFRQRFGRPPTAWRNAPHRIDATQRSAFAG